MYIPKHFEEPDVSVLHALIRSHPLGTWVVPTREGLVVNHVPFLIDATRGEYGTLIGHVARANPVWKSFTMESACVVIFQGPQTYITPSWYPTKQTHGKAVPTWNYAVVHAHGTALSVDESDWLLKHVTELSDLHESERAIPWSVSDAPPDYIDNMLKAIIGIEIPISTLVGKWKMSQNRPQSDQWGTITGLHERGDSNSRQVATLIARHLKKED
ncbi:MAG: FMN-binding negative transcriptional regulator [Anaerolineae bacterium]|nr:FMN-binding negative transcriptional regulator [Anaerolineae bacterium]